MNVNFPKSLSALLLGVILITGMVGAPLQSVRASVAGTWTVNSTTDPGTGVC